MKEKEEEKEKIIKTNGYDVWLVTCRPKTAINMAIQIKMFQSNSNFK
ncbi:hypothetical protein LJ568_13200 [Bacillus halotolerans]|uniref:Uncharacterized protein n=1 Tax=Bacillus halotolerans TaxID=260554 RepID=A0ABY7HW77_9BACI|nr:hypothetical protein [Bacillus halotolerans]MBV5122322.1 hypothetical protein [Bacillus halotolerans]MCC2116624.1 hypothetical protein [Bacillus halotolerans]MDG0767299.1 hypothetical protein [Bacillus halotolerans]UUI82519.1 hypothetical protein NPA28_10520 [Bacillus halotolerans]WAT19446.1 hypothetical protein O0R52_10435 [Bacillus halotolerans]